MVDSPTVVYGFRLRGVRSLAERERERGRGRGRGHAGTRARTGQRRAPCPTAERPADCIRRASLDGTGARAGLGDYFRVPSNVYRANTESGLSASTNQPCPVTVPPLTRAIQWSTTLAPPIALST